jgi:hypothetical protein
MLLSGNHQVGCIATKGAAEACDVPRLSRQYAKVESGSFARRSVPRRSEAIVRHLGFLYFGECMS